MDPILIQDANILCNIFLHIHLMVLELTVLTSCTDATTHLVLFSASTDFLRVSYLATAIYTFLRIVCLYILIENTFPHIQSTWTLATESLKIDRHTQIVSKKCQKFWMDSAENGLYRKMVEMLHLYLLSNIKKKQLSSLF